MTHLRGDARKALNEKPVLNHTVKHHEPATDSLIREYMAQAWDEGWKARGYDVPGMGSVTPNPYDGAA